MNCNKCGKQIAPDDKYCTTCGSQIIAEEIDPPPTIMHCKSCGGSVGGDDSFCMHCGSAVTDASIVVTGDMTSATNTNVSKAISFKLSERLVRLNAPANRVSYVNKYPDISALTPGAAVMLNAKCRDRIISQLRNVKRFEYGTICLVTWAVGITSQLDDLLIATDRYILIYDRSASADILKPSVVISLHEISEIIHEKSLLQINRIIFKVGSNNTVIHIGVGPPIEEFAYYLSILSGNAQSQTGNVGEVTTPFTPQPSVSVMSQQHSENASVADVYSSRYPDIPVLSKEAIVMLDIWCREKLLNQLKLLRSFRFGTIRLLIWNVGIGELEGGCLVGTDTHLLYYRDRKSADLSLPSLTFPLNEMCYWGSNEADTTTITFADGDLPLLTGATDCHNALNLYLSRFNEDFSKRKQNFEILKETIRGIGGMTFKEEQTSDEEDALLQESLINILTLHNMCFPMDLVLMKALKLAINELFEDREITPGEEKVILVLMRENVKQPYDNYDTLKEIFRLWELALLNSGYLRPYRDVEISTHGELIYGYAKCRIIERKIVTERVTGHAGISIPLTKGRGPRIYLGGSKPYSFQKEVDVVYGTGELLITDKKLLFVSGQNTFDLRLSYIHDISAYKDGFKLATSKKQRNFTYILGDSDTTEEFLTILRRVLSGDYCTDKNKLQEMYGMWHDFRALFLRAEMQKRLGKWIDMDSDSLEYVEKDPIPGTKEQQITAISEQLLKDMVKTAGPEVQERYEKMMSGKTDVENELDTAVAKDETEEKNAVDNALASNVLRQIIADFFLNQIKKHPEIAITEAKYQEFIVQGLLPRLKEIDNHRDWEKELLEYRKTCFSFVDGKLQLSQESIGFWTV
ncbi:MAG: Double zinc ribbon [bacterium ADurb.Bin236]|nr:MAG: Double zinc ribbon [bacterium ADurb.Bin236]